MTRIPVLLLAAAIGSISLPVFADDWQATKLRGVVLELVDGDWRQLSRGDVIPDDRVVRTLRTGRVTFQRGNETVDLGPETQVQIFDRSGKPFTTVKQYFGEVAVEADVRQVQHFAVQTQYLTAVVKGTKFTVTADGRGAEVSVQRGHVAVKDADSRQSTVVSAGQSAASGDGTPLLVSGAGQLPVVRDAKGRPVSNASIADKRVPSAGAAAAAAYREALDRGATEKEVARAAKSAEQAAKKAEKAAEKTGVFVEETIGGALHATGEAAGAVGGAVSGALGGGSSSGSSGNSGGGNSGSGNSGNGNSGNGNSGGNSGHGSSGLSDAVGGLVGGLL